MTNLLITFATLVAVTQPTLGSEPVTNTPRLICTNTGDLYGSYYLDITGFEQILNGTATTSNRTLGFKEFRSAINKVADLSCGTPNPYLEGPGTLIACYSGPISDYGNKNNNDAPFEAAFSQNENGLLMTLRGPGVPAGTAVPCQIKY